MQFRLTRVDAIRLTQVGAIPTDAGSVQFRLTRVGAIRLTQVGAILLTQVGAILLTQVSAITLTSVGACAKGVPAAGALILRCLLDP